MNDIKRNSNNASVKSFSNLIIMDFHTFLSLKSNTSNTNNKNKSIEPLKFCKAFDVNIDNAKIIDTIKPNFSIFLYTYSTFF